MNELELKIQCLLEEYKVVSEELNMFIQEMLRCFLYGAILLSVYLGFDLGMGGAKSNVITYLPYGFIMLVIYFLCLSYLNIGLVRYRAKIEIKINTMLGHPKLLEFDSYYNINIQSRGYIRLGNRWFQKIPSPFIILSFVIFIFICMLFVYNNIYFNINILIFAIIICFFLAIYIYFIYPRLLDKHINKTYKDIKE